MLDIKVVRQDPQKLAHALEARGFVFDVDAFSALDAQRKQADEWLQQFQATQAAWQVGLALVQSKAATLQQRTFGATLLTNKLRGGGGGGLAAADRTGLRVQILTALREIEAGPLRSQCCRAVALLLAEVEERPGLGGGPASLVLTEAGQAGLLIDCTLLLLSMVPTYAPSEEPLVPILQVQHRHRLRPTHTSRGADDDKTIPALDQTRHARCMIDTRAYFFTLT